jgi:hypothetical protein
MSKNTNYTNMDADLTLLTLNAVQGLITQFCQASSGGDEQLELALHKASMNLLSQSRTPCDLEANIQKAAADFKASGVPKSGDDIEALRAEREDLMKRAEVETDKPARDCLLKRLFAVEHELHQKSRA